MNKLEIDNLDLIIKACYSHVCLNGSDLKQFINIPKQRKLFYPLKAKGDFFNKKGFFNNGRTACWTDHSIPEGHVKIANKIPTNASQSSTEWSDLFSFKEQGGANKIAKMMKLIAFW